jgi:hypothetical protein
MMSTLTKIFPRKHHHWHRRPIDDALSSSSSSSWLARQILERVDLLPPPSPTIVDTAKVGIDKETFQQRLQQTASNVDYWQNLADRRDHGHYLALAVGVVNPSRSCCGQ